ncbi:hypothetical protein [Roseibium polysiphoniae]|uniref:Uncharacterized protein n=1 Tax=Roseibium polysiphoniae TaxID=2571221 RepID=A0ABR9C8S0_9HYPH|nr:hypothetical protein [Roseibium polysiphoniae]MBD8876285.1 hypothetical protein [Roseibium polysiphoniae]
MAYQDRDTSRTETAALGAGWFIAGGLAVALIIGGILYTNGYFASDDEVSIELNLPNLDTKTITTPIPGTDG